MDVLQESISDVKEIVSRYFEAQASSAKELTQEFRLVRQAVEDTRNRVTALEGRIVAVEQEQLRVRNDSHSLQTQHSADARAMWQLGVMFLIAAGGWIYNFVHK